jgi:hypothetical protein
MLKEPVDLALTSIAAKVDDLRHQLVAQLFGVARDHSGFSEPELVERLEALPGGLLLAAEAVEASMRTSVPAKIAAFGRLLANAATDGAVVEQNRVLVKVLAGLEEPHIRLLGVLGEVAPATTVQGIDAHAKGWRMGQVVERDPGLAVVIEPLLVALQSSGLVRDEGSAMSWQGAQYEDHQWVLTDFGTDCLALLGTVLTSPTAEEPRVGDDGESYSAGG